MIKFFQVTPFSVIFYLITVFWLLEFIFFADRTDSKDGKRTFILILSGIILNLLIAIVLAVFKITQLSGRTGDIFSYGGLVIYVLGLAVRYSAIISLGSNFNRKIEIKREQTLVSSGLYRWIQHPSYLGLILLTAGAVAAIGNLLGTVIAFLSMTVIVLRRIKEEEMMMRDRLGERYLSWQKKRYRLFPFIY